MDDTPKMLARKVFCNLGPFNTKQTQQLRYMWVKLRVKVNKREKYPTPNRSPPPPQKKKLTKEKYIKWCVIQLFGYSEASEV